MFVTCQKCSKRFNDEYRTTICPHETFAANDGKNNFRHHTESPILEARSDDAMSFESKRFDEREYGE